MLDVLKSYWLLFLIGPYPNGPIGGLAGTVCLALLGLVLSMPCALILATARLSRSRTARLASQGLVALMRGTPFLVVIFWAYFLMPALIGRSVSPFLVLVGALVIYESAYLSEIVRAAILAIPKGQTEAAYSLGLPAWKTMALVILPQALVQALPSLVGQLISIIKETSLGYIIGVQEFTFAATQANTNELTKPAQIFGILAITYFALCFSLSQAARWLEGRIQATRDAPA